MRPYFVGNPSAAVLFYASLAIWALIELRQALHRRAEATDSDRDSLWIVRLFAAAATILASFTVRARVAALPSGAVTLGISLALIWAGIGLRLWCFRTLGHYFTFKVMTSADQPVITSGPYRVLRHPSYAAILLILAGIGLSFGNWLSLAALTVIPFLGFVNRISVEEAALSEALGSRYTAYARGRKRVIPFVW